MYGFWLLLVKKFLDHPININIHSCDNVIGMIIHVLPEKEQNEMFWRPTAVSCPGFILTEVLSTFMFCGPYVCSFSLHCLRERTW